MNTIKTAVRQSHAEYFICIFQEVLQMLPNKEHMIQQLGLPHFPYHLMA